jgi:hypothetical protein
MTRLTARLIAGHCAVETTSEEDFRFWLDAWGFLKKHAPDDALFEKYTEADLIDEYYRGQCPDDERIAEREERERASEDQ